MITYPLPRRIRYIPAAAIFTAVFNVPTAGKYDFAGQSKIFIPLMQANSPYLIDSISIGGNISGENYLDAIETVPVFNLRKSLASEAILQPIPIAGYEKDRQIVHFFKTGVNNCGLIADVAGVLKQTPDLIGLASITLSITLTIHLIEDRDFEKEFTQGT